MKLLFYLSGITLFFITGCNMPDSSNSNYLYLESNQPISSNRLSASSPVPNNLNQVEQNAHLIIKGKVIYKTDFCN